MLDQRAPAGSFRVDDRLDNREEAVAEVVELRAAPECPPEVEEHRRRDIAIVGRNGAPGDPESGVTGHRPDRSQEPRLADPCFTSDEQKLAPTGCSFVDPT